ncbi:centromere protein F-like [Callorhinchus milii]|uniref:centromere protein F-like n=1 Tax=Callorhinchus milii TaxID=7868 RepID=UPI001C3FAC04|nr:centromere protein F-like [Callorhinchus milii]
MSWPLEEWKGELSSQALRKVTECERQLEKLGRERQQRQLQLDAMESTFHKQQQKLEDERHEHASLRREAQSLRDEASQGERSRQRLCQELQVKEALVCSLEGQLVAARKRTDNLEHELKRLETELERNLRSPLPSPSASQLYPGLSNTSSPCPRDNQGAQWEDLQRKYQREAEERQRLGTEVNTLRLQVQPLELSHRSHGREDNRAQSSPTNCPWQNPDHQPPSTPAGRGAPLSVLPWEERATQQPPCRPLTPDPTHPHLSWAEESSSPQVDGLREENRVLRSTVTELEIWVQSQEKEIKIHDNRLQELQSRLEMSEAQLAAKQQTLNHGQQLLSRANQGQELANTKCAGLEQRLKQVTAELGCLRQNAESARHSAEQRLRQREREHQQELQELAEQQSGYQMLEQESREAQSTASHQIQQLQREHLELQATVDKVTAQKQLVDRELQELEEKVDWAVGELAAYQKREADLQREKQLTLEKNSTCQGQSTQRLLQLEAQLTRMEQDLTWSQTSREEMRGENLSLSVKVEALQREINVQREGLSVNPGPQLLSCPSSLSQQEASQSDPHVVVSSQGVLPSQCGDHQAQEAREGSPAAAQPLENGAVCGVIAVPSFTEAAAGVAAAWAGLQYLRGKRRF